MTRKEYNDFRYIRSYKTRGFKLSYGTTLTIPVDGSRDYKARLHELYMGWGFHPAAVRIDRQYFDDRMRIIYIYGLSYDLHGEQKSWETLYTDDEKLRFRAYLNM